MSAAPAISVIMCTRNRAGPLAEVLETLAAMEVPEGLSWEMVLVDNGSTDATAEVAERFAARLPLRRVEEPKAGLSNARNRGVGAARGAHICWTDDDVVVDPGWLGAYAEAFARHPEAAFFGGVVAPIFEIAKPRWMEENYWMLASIFAERDFGAVDLRFEAGSAELPYGANFAVRADVQRRHLYDPALGVGPGLKRLGEETDVMRRILAEGGHGIWVPGAKVGHKIPARRISLAYVGEYQRSAGDTWAHSALTGGGNVMGLPRPVERPKVMGAPLPLILAWAVHWGKYALSRAFPPSGRWLDHWMRAHFNAGAIARYRQDANGS